MDVTVVHARRLTTVQDLGRPGHRAAGVPRSGAMDMFAARAANLLAGNPETAAVLETTLGGIELEFSADAIVVACDAGGAAAWRAVHVSAGELWRTGPRTGCRGYVAVAGGFDVPLVLGSRSTYLPGSFGGFEGRALRDGDVLRVFDRDRVPVDRRSLSPYMLPAYSSSPVVRVLRGEHADAFDATLFGAAYTVLPESDRMGVRLDGPTLARADARELASATVTPGTVQVPPDGRPIVLMADAQTIGGYPRAAHVIDVDLPLVAQLRPGDALRFRPVELAEAHALVRDRERDFALLREGLAARSR